MRPRSSSPPGSPSGLPSRRRPAISFIGRQPEQQWLQRRIDALLQGRGGVVLVSGPPGIGKTTLVREVLGPHDPLWARTWEFGEAPALWPVIQLVRALARRQPGAITPDEDLLAPVLKPGSGAPSVPPVMLYSAVIETVRRAARSQPVLMVIDDLHAADPSTLELLAMASDAWRSAPVLVLGTRRTTDTRTSPEADRLLARLAQDADDRHLDGLSRDEVAALVAARLDRPATDSELAGLMRRAGGSPLFLEGLLAGGLPASDGGLPHDLRQTLVDRLDALPADTRRLLQRASLAREALSEERLGEVLGWALSDVSSAVGPALAERLLSRDGSRLYWTHQLYAEATASTLSASEAKAGHQAWLAALDRLEGQHLSARAEHALAADDPSAPERLMAAGRAASARGGFATAADLYERAMLQFTEPAQRVQAQLARAWALHHAGNTRGAQEAAEAALRLARRPDATPARSVPEVACAMADMTHFGLRDAAVTKVIDEALALVHPDDHTARAHLLSRQVTLWAGQSEHFDARLESLAEQARVEAEQSDDPTVLHEALTASLQIWRDDRLTVRTRAARALESLAPRLDLVRQFDVARWAFNTALENCDGTWARRALQALHTLADALQTPRTALVAQLRQATLWQLEGRFDQIDPSAIEATARRAADPHFRMFGPGCAVLQHIVAKDTAAVKALLPHLYEAVQSWPHFPAVALQAALVAHHAGDTAKVDAVYLGWRARGFREAPWWGNLQGLATCAIIAMDRGDREAAAQVLERMGDYPEGYAGTGPVAPLGPLAVTETRLRRWLGEDASEAEARARRLCERLGAPEMLRWLDADAPTPPTETAPGPTAASMVRSGDVWLFRLGDAEVRLRDRKGFGYLAELLARPGSAVHVLELTSGTRKDEVEGDAGPVLDAAARQAYTERAQYLYAELAEAEDHHDFGRIERLTVELDALTEELARATGLGGRDRKVASNAERARSAVKQALRRALKALSKELPELADHLDRSVETGAVCRYTPAPHGLRVTLTRRR